jgi:hypothetical protein
MGHEPSDSDFIRENVAMVLWQVRNKGKLPENLDALQTKWERDRPKIVEEWLQVQAELNQRGFVISRVSK